MSLAVQILRSGYEYVLARAFELRLRVTEPSWFAAYLVAREIHGFCRSHMDAIQEVLEPYVTATPQGGPAAVVELRGHHRSVLDCLDALVDAVHQRDAAAADRGLDALVEALDASIHLGMRLMGDAETLGGDLAQRLGEAIQRRRDAG